MLDRIEALGLTDETLVVVTSDHGEELFDHGLATHGPQPAPRADLGAADPGRPRGPGRASGSRRPSRTATLPATVARLAGVDPRGLAGGRDLLRADEADPARVFFSTTTGFWNGAQPQTILGLRDGSHVLHYAPEGAPWGEPTPGTEGDWRLFDLSTDAGEDSDVTARDAARAERMRTAIQELVRELESRRRVPEIEAGDATMERLKDLGYVGDDE